jgi:prepilin-type N-terminal cleavage/methylation domain-containing protein
MRKEGFTLIELLLAMSLSLLVFVAVFEFFGITRDFFFKLKEAEEDSLAIQAALEKLRIDLLRAGFGLEAAIRAGAVEGIGTDGALVILSQADRYPIIADCSSGEKRVTLEKTSGLGAGDRVCLAGREKAERGTIAALEGNTVVLSDVLENSYAAENAQLLLVEEVSYFLDKRTSVLRRKVNMSPAQPLLDNAGLFEFAYLKEDNLVRIKLADKKNKESTYGLSIFPKNLGLVLPRTQQDR